MNKQRTRCTPRGMIQYLDRPLVKNKKNKNKTKTITTKTIIKSHRAMFIYIQSPRNLTVFFVTMVPRRLANVKIVIKKTGENCVVMLPNLSPLMAPDGAVMKISIVATWWRHQKETFSALLALCVGNLPVTGEFPAQRPVTRSFDVFFDLRLNKRLSKPSWGWWFWDAIVVIMASL